MKAFSREDSSKVPAGWPVCPIPKPAGRLKKMADIVYLDNAATTFPKPREALERMIDLYTAHGVSPGRGGYDLALEAEEMVSAARKRLCRLFGGDDPARVIFASNATDALNLVIQGAVRSGATWSLPNWSTTRSFAPCTTSGKKA